ncbi:chemotaxis protein CheB [Aquabacterium sp. A7-Y]|uniref:chemotaxis protein CheB n=1 Tax=Aquabacterium sp. A7-Y TaxID=1349605 RepID=UPI00223D9B65|nr:chemotaxis protein CheB [Aquabacterium sp. A7-Y]MCW7537042.1 chemotaxis protein CheB [Aquabacterium sp. A7-Y]
MARRDVVVIGASAGGVVGLQRLVAGLSADFPATLLVVLHVGAHHSTLPALLSRAGPLPACRARHGEAVLPGRIYVAPPDHHLLVARDTLRLTRGPKENHSRPAVDPLFRSAAVEYGPRVVGVVLTGYLDDGSDGARAVAECGGVVVVQDPAEAFAPEMPDSALRAVRTAQASPLAEIPALLEQLTREELALPPVAVPETLLVENAISLLEGHSVEELKKIASPSSLTCPDCGGSLWRIKDGERPRFRCHTGHAFSELALRDAQRSATEESLWSAVRSQQEEALLAQEMAQSLRLLGEDRRAKAEDVRAQKLMQRVKVLRSLLEEQESPP